MAKKSKQSEQWALEDAERKRCAPLGIETFSTYDWSAKTSSSEPAISYVCKKCGTNLGIHRISDFNASDFNASVPGPGPQVAHDSIKCLETLFETVQSLQRRIQDLEDWRNS